ncbi:MAG: hypothetical protein F6K42_03120 [Leptolyngbya sp. SIO1D8]|nr:hypothetical protein [Leptolyngbya sp. SIO1D8]
MIPTIPENSNLLFDELAIADTKHFQIAVPSTQKVVERKLSSNLIPISKRIYQTQGWLIYNHEVIAQLNGFQIGEAASENSVFKPIRRLAPSIPIAFEARSAQPLPTQVSTQATFACSIPGISLPYNTVFRQSIPRFVRVYPFQENDSPLDKVGQMLIDEATFISQNHEKLKQIPFYQKNFGL